MRFALPSSHASGRGRRVRRAAQAQDLTHPPPPPPPPPPPTPQTVGCCVWLPSHRLAGLLGLAWPARPFSGAHLGLTFFAVDIVLLAPPALAHHHTLDSTLGHARDPASAARKGGGHHELRVPSGGEDLPTGERRGNEAEDGDGARGARPMVGRGQPIVICRQCGCSAQCVGTHCPACPPQEAKLLSRERGPPAAPLVASLRLMSRSAAPMRGEQPQPTVGRAGQQTLRRDGQEPSRASQTRPNKASKQQAADSTRQSPTRLDSSESSSSSSSCPETNRPPPL